MIQQRTNEWLELRAGKFTASAFGDLMATTKSGPAASRSNLIARLAVERMTGIADESYVNAAMQRGIELEPLARGAYEAYTGELVAEVAFVQHPTLPNCGCSPDGLIGADGLLELKCPNQAKHFDALRSGAHVKEYWWQLHGQLWVTGRQWVDAVSYHPTFPERHRLAIVRVRRDDAVCEQLAAAVRKAENEILAIIEELDGMRKAA